MKKINHNYKCWALLLCLLIWLPLTSMAQSVAFEMVVEKIDGTEMAFRITDDYPLLDYSYYGVDGVNSLQIQTTDGSIFVPCSEIKRLYTREAKAVLGDVNGDGDVDIADAVCIVNYVVSKPNTTFNEAAADANGDGDIDIADAVHIVNFVVGKIQTLAPRFEWNLPEPE